MVDGLARLTTIRSVTYTAGLLWPVGLLLTVVSEIVLLHSVAAVGVAPYYPRADDQVEYLTEAYLALQAIKDDGVLSGLAHTLVEPRVQGWLVQLQAGVIFLFTGAHRLAALDLNIAYLVTLLAVVGTWVRRAWGIGSAFTFLAVVVGAETVTRSTGGVFDFRLDFALMCAWGLWLGFLATRDLSRGEHGSLVVGLTVLSLLVITVRTIAFVYVAATSIILAVAQRERSAVSRSLLASLAISTVVEGLFVVQNWRLVREYYVGGHLLSVEKDIRSDTIGVSDLASALAFYPRSLLTDHLGLASTVMIIAVIVLSAGILAVLLPDRSDTRPRDTNSYRNWPLIVLGGGVLVPALALSLDPAKSDVVGGVLAPPVALLTAYVLATVQRALSTSKIRPAAVGVGVACLVLAFASQVRGLRARETEFSAQGDSARASRFILALADDIHARAARPAIWSMDAHLDFASVAATRVYYFEQRGVWLDLVAGIGEANIASTLSIDDVRAQASASDALILTERTTAPRPIYPYDASLEATHDALFDIAARNFVLVAGDHFLGRNVFGFARREST